MPDVVVVHDGEFVGVAAPTEAAGRACAGRDQGRVEAGSQDLRQGPLRRPQACSRRRRGTAAAGGGPALRVRSKAGWTPRTSVSSRRTRSPTSLMPRSSRARPSREWDDGKLTVWTGTQRPFGVQGELTARSASPTDAVRVIVPDTGAGLRRQAHRRSGRRGGPAGPRGRQAGQAGLDARGRVHLGLFPAGGRDRDHERRQARRHAHGLGVSQLSTRAARGSARPTRCPISVAAFHPVPAPPSRRVPIARWPRRPTISPASRTWTSWPTP